MKKLFAPPGSRIDGDRVVLKDGAVVPLWTVIAVPPSSAGTFPEVHGDVGGAGGWVDLVTGATSASDPRTPASTVAAQDGEYSGAGFSRWVRRADLVAAAARLLPSEADASVEESDPGYAGSPTAAGPSEAAVSTAPGDDFSNPDYDLGHGYTMRDALVWRGKPQELAPPPGVTREAVALDAKRVAESVLPEIDAAGEITLGWRIRSWIASYSSGLAASRWWGGGTVTLSFTGTTEQVYAKAVALSRRLSYDSLSIDYSSVGGPFVTVSTGAGVGRRRRVNTTYDGATVCEGKLLCALRSTTDWDSTVTPSGDQDVVPFSGDSYYGIERLLRDRPDLFGGAAAAARLASQLGFNSNPLVAGKPPSSGSPVEGLARTLAEAVACPIVSAASRLFPTSRHPDLRRLSDASQLDDGKTQTTTPFNVRTNNPLGVPVVKGVTDLRTRFGFLGEAEGKAVYRDHVGGAAAGLAYLSQMGAGTLASVAKSLFTGKLSGAGTSTDLTDMTPAKLFQDVTSLVFGAADPSGALAECSSPTSGSMDDVITQAAALAAAAINEQTSPLTKNEWKAAWQIHRNEPNGDLTKTTTGVALPAQEAVDPQLTGAATASQGAEKPHEGDEDGRGSREKWNPVSNYARYSDTLWGSSGSNWIEDGVLTYERKASESDVAKMAKARGTPVMNQDPANTTRYADLDFGDQGGSTGA